MGLKPQITYQLTGGGRSLSVYTVAPDIESRIMQAVDGSDDFPPAGLEAAVLSVCRPVLDPDPFAHNHTPILTTAEIRPHLRALLAGEYPRLPVIGYQEFTPDVELTVLHRFTLEE